MKYVPAATQDMVTSLAQSSGPYLARRASMQLASHKRGNIGSTGRDVKHRRERFGREFDEPIALPNGRDAPHDLGSAANAL
jgi:hypothetical protein